MNRKTSKIHLRIAIATWLIALGSSVFSIVDLGGLTICRLNTKAYCKAEAERVVLLRLLPALALIGASMLVGVKASEEEGGVSE